MNLSSTQDPLNFDADPDPDEPFRNEEIFIISLFSKVQIWGFGVKIFFLQFLVDILPLGSGSVDPHIFADPDPGSQNLADPDPKHCL